MTANTQERNRTLRISGSMGFGIGAVVIALVLLAYYAFTWRSYFHFQYAMDICVKPFCDLARYYYPMGEAIFRTRLPVEGFLYSPFFGILMAVFTPLGLDASLVLWGILQALFVVLYLLLFRRLVPAGLPVQLLFVALALSSFPLLHTLSWGQVSLFYTVAILGMLVLLERNRLMLAATLFAFAVSFKFFPLIFLAPSAVAIRRNARFLLIAVAVCVTFLLIIPGLLLGIDGMLGFYKALLEAFRASDWVSSSYNSQHLPHVLQRLAKAVGMNPFADLPYLTQLELNGVAAAILTLISYGIAAANVGLVFLIQRARLPHANLWSFHVLFLSIPFILKTTWPVDMVYLAFGQALLIWRLLEKEERTRMRATIAFVLATMSIILSNIVLFNFIGDRFRYGSYGSIFWSAVLLLTASYIELVPSALRKMRLSFTSETK